MKDKIASLIPEKFRRYPFAVWGCVILTFLVVTYTLGPDWVRETIDWLLGKVPVPEVVSDVVE